MASSTPTTENLYTGDGTTDLFSFTFPYISIGDVYVSVAGVAQTALTEYIFANATTIQILTPPPVGAVVRIYRNTDITDVKALFFPGSAIRARDLNDNFTQGLYVTQESSFESDAAVKASEEAAESAAQAQAAAEASIATAEASIAVSNAADAKATSALAGVTVAEDAATQASADAAQASTDAAAAQEAATAAEEYAQEVADAIVDGAVISVNGQSGVVKLGVEQLDDFAYYPASEQVTLLGPCVVEAGTFSGTEYTSGANPNLYFVWPKTNTQVYDVLSQLSAGDALTVCYYSAVGTVYTELETTFSSLGNNGGAVDSWYLQLNDSVPGAVLGDYPVVFKSPLITNGQLPITTGQALIYDQTTEKWRPEDVSLNIASLPTLP